MKFAANLNLKKHQFFLLTLYRNHLIVLKPLLNARDYTSGNLMKLYLHLSILKRFRNRILNAFCTAVIFGITVNCVTTNNRCSVVNCTIIVTPTDRMFYL